MTMLGIRQLSSLSFRAIRSTSSRQTRCNSTVAPKYSPNLLDIRVGKIIDIKRHENADKLYVSKIQIEKEPPKSLDTEQVGEEEKSTKEPRYLQVCSGLVDFIPITDLLHKEVVILRNLKPSKMRGVESQAMLLAASKQTSSPDENEAKKYIVEVMNPPKGSEIGDVLGFTGIEYPDIDTIKELKNIKSKVWEDVSRFLKVNSQGELIFIDDSHKLVNINDTKEQGSQNSFSVAYVTELTDCPVS